MKFRGMKVVFLILAMFITGCFSVPVSASSPSYDSVVRSPQVTLKGNNKDQVTIMIYMNGSDLESEDNEATADLQEMIKAGNSDKVNVIVQTMGTKKWSTKLGIASNRTQTFQVTGSGLKLLRDNLGQLDCTSSDTLQEFVTWTAKNYPANRYILQFWNHGAGSVYGFGYDEYQDWNASLTLDEIQSALRSAGTYFDFIGMDCCIMSNLEVCCALYDFCDYVILSEDFESGLGWYYTNWLKALYQNSSIDTITLAKKIIDDMVAKNENDSTNGDEAILSLIDEGTMRVLMTAWKDFAYNNEDSLTGSNYSQKRTRSGPVRVHPLIQKTNLFSWWDDEDSDDDASMSDYYVTDIMAVAQNIDSSESAALSSALNNSIVYTNCTSNNTGLTGLAVTLPYGDSEFYSDLKTVFANCGLDNEYITWLKKFTTVSAKTDYYDYDDWSEDWDGWDDYDDDYDWDFWDFFEDDDYEDFWEDDDNWGWSDEDWDGEGGVFGFIDWLFDLEEDEDYDDDDDHDYYSHDYYNHDSHGGNFGNNRRDDDDYEDDEDESLLDLIFWLFE